MSAARTCRTPAIGKLKDDVEITQFEVKQLPKAKITAVVKPGPALKAGRLEFVEWSNAAADTNAVAECASPSSRW